MRKTTLICDRCALEATGNSEYEIRNAGWKGVTLKAGHLSNERTLKEYLLCPKCSEQLGLAETKQTTENEKSLADRLIECIAEIVAENTPAE